MIDREQVLHVARLARLELTEDEVGRFSDELSKVFDWVETINELEGLDDPLLAARAVGLHDRAVRAKPRRAPASAAGAGPGARHCVPVTPAQSGSSS